MKLLHVDSSALGSHSVSRQLSAEVIAELQRLHPGIETRYHHANGPMDFQEPYLRALLGFLGIDQVEFVRTEGVNMGDEHKAKALSAARQSIGTLGTLAQAA